MLVVVCSLILQTTTKHKIPLSDHGYWNGMLEARVRCARVWIVAEAAPGKFILFANAEVRRCRSVSPVLLGHPSVRSDRSLLSGETNSQKKVKGYPLTK